MPANRPFQPFRIADAQLLNYEFDHGPLTCWRRVHHSEPVRAWLTEHTEQIEVFFLPAYSPELNPDEYVNGQLKAELRKQPPPRDLDALERRVLSIMRRLQKLPHRLLALFRHPVIAYAA